MNEQTHGIAAEEDYPYVSKHNKCNGGKIRNAKLYKPISGTTKVEKNNEEAMKAALAEHGPLLVIVDAINLAFYSSGIISGASCDHGTVNHAVRITFVGKHNPFEKYFDQIVIGRASRL